MPAQRSLGRRRKEVPDVGESKRIFHELARAYWTMAATIFFTGAGDMSVDRRMRGAAW
jgi:hypothetical protein